MRFSHDPMLPAWDDPGAARSRPDSCLWSVLGVLTEMSRMVCAAVGSRIPWVGLVWFAWVHAVRQNVGLASVFRCSER